MKHKVINGVFFLVFVTLICVAAVKNADFGIDSAISDSVHKSNVTVILDAGHGGEDGGAVAPDGTNEKDINLHISKNIADLFEVIGINYISVRNEDVSVGDNTLSGVRERKRSDILAREKLVNSTPNSIFFSIHQNKYDIPKYKGTQVFYGSDNPESKELAQCIQDSVKERVQPENNRQIKPSGKNIYLLYYAKAPAVMTECGFMSNPNELSLLKDEIYCKKISYSICHGLQIYLSKKEMNLNADKE